MVRIDPHKPLYLIGVLAEIPGIPRTDACERVIELVLYL